jgi:enolase-phosphatase E1
MSKPTFILTDIEGTTTSVSFVYDVLFPYFRENMQKVRTMIHLPEVQAIFKETIRLSQETENKIIATEEEVIETLIRWSNEDKKLTPLKDVQGILWKEAYETGIIKGHVYDDVAPALKAWKDAGLQLGVFSSGSIAAQKLIFGYSVAGDLTPYFSAYFDTTTGGKREVETYNKISQELKILPSEILFLSDIVEELEAAQKAGLQTIQLVRPGTLANWKNTASSFSDILRTDAMPRVSL